MDTWAPLSPNHRAPVARNPDLEMEVILTLEGKTKMKALLVVGRTLWGDVQNVASLMVNFKGPYFSKAWLTPEEKKL